MKKKPLPKTYIIDYLPHHPAFVYNCFGYYRRIMDAPIGGMVLHFLTHPDNLKLALASTDAGGAALDPLQEAMRKTFSPELLSSNVFLTFVGNIMHPIMAANGRPLLQEGVALPADRHVVFEHAALYQSLGAQAA